MKYINVVIENRSRHTDNFFTYRTDDSKIKVGDKVLVPFGKGNKHKSGFVFECGNTPSCAPEIIKEIIQVDEDESLTEEIISTASWMKQRYAVTYSDALRCFTPNVKVSVKGKKKEPYKDIEGKYTHPSRLTEEQKNAILEINKAISNRKQESFLIHGVTASGKTQVYMEAVEKCISMGRKAIVLVPEISLTNQIIENFAGRFGKDKIAVMHSKLTQRERYDEWQRIRKGNATIVIGARMGVFAPMENLGLIVLDEEHEATYKSDMTPKYDTVEVALKRLKYFNGVLLLGSATPSVSSYERCREGIYKLIELKHRYNNTPLPKVEVVDMREELRCGNTSLFSRKLKSSIEKTLEKEQQVILLQNRRGYYNFVSCRKCGSVMKCPKCEVSLVFHKDSNAMVCHYCGRKYPVPKSCPVCGSGYIKYFGVGTEQVEETTRTLFQDVTVDRLDLDTAKNRKEIDKILKGFSSGKTRILIGTQLVAKGLDFQNVGLVGVIAGDVTLNIPDYRSSERTFQLITQVAGRAGRGEEQGLVIVQTYEPDNYAFQTAKSYDYTGFFQQEIKLRRCMEYPPFGDIIMVNFTSDDEGTALNTASRCKKYMENVLGRENSHRVLSPKVAAGFKGNNSFRHYIIVKCPKKERNRYMFYLESFEKIVLNENVECVINVDVNPYSIF